MGPLASAQAASSYLEKLRSKVPLLYERDDVLLTMLQKNADVEMVSPRSMRMSLKIRPGGKGSQQGMDGADMGRGSGTTRIETQVSPIFYKFAIEVNKLVEYATNKSGKAVENIAKTEVKDGMRQFRAFLDKLLQTDGTGTLANITVVTGGPANAILTLGTPYYHVLLYYNQTVAVYNANLTTFRGSCNIVLIDPDNKQVTVDNLPANTVATDLLLVDGLQGVASPTSMYGLKYHQNNSAAGTYLNQSRANYPELRTPTVVAGGSLVTGHVRLALNKIKKVLGINSLDGAKLIAYTAVEQEHAWEQLGVTISEIIRQGGGNEEMPDLLFKKKGTMGGVPIKVSINADPTRIDFLAIDQWVRAVIQDIDMYEEGGQTVFQLYGASGGLAAAYIFYYIVGLQIASMNPRLGAYIQQLNIPTGY